MSFEAYLSKNWMHFGTFSRFDIANAVALSTPYLVDLLPFRENYYDLVVPVPVVPVNFLAVPLLPIYIYIYLYIN
jgi:hypothetical protein